MFSHKGLFVCAVAMAAASTAFAQQGDEIIVTATKRAESIQDVPISISAYGAEFIEDSGVEDIHDIALYSPNFTIGSSSQISNNRIGIRGVASVGNAGIEPSVGVFVDGIYYPRPASVIGNLVDIEVFEVLRGPQGTLFGRNTPMGALNIRTRDPDFDKMSGMYTAGFGSHNLYHFGGAVNVPLSDSAALRFAGKYSDRDGYGTNLLNGENFGARDDLNFRSRLLWKPTDNLSVRLTADYSTINSEGATIEYLNSASSPVLLETLAGLINLDPGLAGIDGTQLQTTDPVDHDIYQDHRDNLDDEQYGFAGEITYTFDSGHELKSITGVRNWKAQYFESAIRLPVKLFPRKTDYDNNTFSQEFQLLSPTGGQFDYVLGAFYYDESYTISQDFDLGSEFCNPVVFGVLFQQAVTGTGSFAGIGPLPPAQAQAAALGQANTCDALPQIDASDSDFAQELSSYALFGQGTYHLSDRVSITFGGRYTSDDKTADFTNVVRNPFVTGLEVRDNENHADLRNDEFGFDKSKFTYFANVRYNLAEAVMLFLTTSSGHKSGGFNTDGTFPSLTRMQRIFGPEDATSYELGIKSKIFDGTMLFNATAYRMDIKGFQDRAFDGVSFITRNVGELRQQGFEVDMNWNPIDQIGIIGALSYLDSEFIDYQNASPLPGGPVQNLSGRRAHFSPEWQYSLVGDWHDTFSLADSAEYFLRGEMQHIGEQNVGGNTNQNPQSIQDPYTLFNARIGLRDDDNRWQITLWGKNLSGKGYCTVIFDQPFGTQLGGLNVAANTLPQRCAVGGSPKTYGVEVTFRH